MAVAQQRGGQVAGRSEVVASVSTVARVLQEQLVAALGVAT